MGATWTRHLATALAVWGLATPAGADELPPLPPLPLPAKPAATPRVEAPSLKASPEPAKATPPAATADDKSKAPAAPTQPEAQPAKGGSEATGAAPADAAKPAEAKAESAEKKPPASPVVDVDVSQVDPAAARAETAERLKALPPNDDKAATAATKALREVLEERVTLLNALDGEVKKRQAAENPKPSPEKEMAEGKAELERIKVILDQSAKDPDVLVPPLFRTPSGPGADAAQVSEAAQAEMKEAIDAAQADSKDKAAKLEQFRTDQTKKPATSLAALRAARDKTFQRVAAMKAKNTERAATSVEGKTPEARTLALEKLVNAGWETRVESERLRAQEAHIALETRRAELPALNAQVLEANALLAQKTLDRMKLRYRTLATRQEADLQKKAVAEQTRAVKSDDPLERYRAKRTAELLELEVRVQKGKNALTTNPSPSYEEQSALADRALNEFNEVKKLLDDGKVSHLDVLRLNNDFRRLGMERAKIVRNELAITANRLTLAENTLGTVELELIYDARDDQYELNNLLERLPKSLHPKAQAMFDEFERRHAALLIQRRDNLQKLAVRAEETHEQVLRRLSILDEHFGFIRTKLFWIRDEEPVGKATLTEVRQELTQLGRATLRVGGEAIDGAQWGRVSPEFLAASFGLVILPWPLYRLRRLLGRLGRVAVDKAPSVDRSPPSVPTET